MKRLIFSILLALCAILPLFAQFPNGEIRSGELWLDTNGQHINAHGGGILYHKGVYYWFGEHKSDHTSSALVGVTCYSSPNLTTWTNRGVVLPVVETAGHDLEKGCTMERPKVIYNPRTRKFVMWFHLELKGQGYAAARTAVAISDRPEGPYTYLHSLRPNAGRLPIGLNAAVLDTLRADDYKEWWTPRWRRAIERGLFVKRDLQGGQMARDMTLFVDDDGVAYHIYSSEDNLTLHIARLSPDFLSHTGEYTRIFPGGHNEAPTLFKHGGRYWLIASGCTGWDPNAARLYSATDLFGEWTSHGNPCLGPLADRTFNSQGTFVLPIHGKRNAFLFMADRWTPRRPSDARYIWLPIQFTRQGIPFLEWMDAWRIKDVW